MSYVEPPYVQDGQVVYLVTKDGKLLLCEVLVAAGNTARIANELKRIDKWVSLRSLRIQEQLIPEDT